MKAAVLYEPNTPLAIEDVNTNKPASREVLIRTAVAGLCHSDSHFMEGLYPWPLPAVLGHESSGIVEQVGLDVTYVKPGDHVVTCLSVFCGVCEMCVTGRPVLCTRADVKLPPGVADRFSWSRPEKLNQFVKVIDLRGEPSHRFSQGDRASRHTGHVSFPSGSPFSLLPCARPLPDLIPP